MFLQESSGNLLLEKQTHLKATRTQGEQVFHSQGLGWKRPSQSYPALFSGLAQLVPRAGVSGVLWKPLVVHLSWEFLQHFGDAPSELGVNGGESREPRSVGWMRGGAGGAPGKDQAGDQAQSTKGRRGLGVASGV